MLSSRFIPWQSIISFSWVSVRQYVQQALQEVIQHVENCGNHWNLLKEQKTIAFKQLKVHCKTEFEVREPVEPVGPAVDPGSNVVSPEQEASDTDLEKPVLEAVPRPCPVVPKGSTAAVRVPEQRKIFQALQQMALEQFSAGTCISYTLDYPISSCHEFPQCHRIIVLLVSPRMS